ncbi:MAG: DUF2798 domain-containing protein [Woeseia sp.]
MKLHRRWFRLVHAVLMNTIMVFCMTLVLTIFYGGIGTGFLGEWLRAFAIAYVVALPLTYFVGPIVRVLAERLVAEN